MLGDRIRMQDAFPRYGVYIRSMATRGHRGGLAQATRVAVTGALEAAGFDVILIETVGVGQGESILRCGRSVLAVVAPGLG